MAQLTMTRGCDQSNNARLNTSSRRDPHSYSEPDKFRVSHVDLELRIGFKEKVLQGKAVLSLERRLGNRTAPLVLDTRDLLIHRVEVETTGKAGEFYDSAYEIGQSDAILGAPLRVDVPNDVASVRITYATSPDATALQWIDPVQTAGKRYPFLYTQSQEIHARSWIPIQDTPAMRLTYNARVKTPTHLTAVMSADSNPKRARGGTYEFRMSRPIPPYLIALAVGDIDFEETGTRTGVYAEPALVRAAAYEFGEANKMLETAEQLYGPYRWSHFDILVLPPSFPFGGMENPDIIFVTPTLIAGDRSAVSVISHELAHAWAGNLVTNATWSDFWLNEGFTTYIERRLQERLYGKVRAAMEDVLALERLRREMSELEPRDQILHIDLDGRDPDAGATLVPYVKGYLFLKSLEELFGRNQMDKFLRGYFDHFAFQSVTTEQMVAYVKDNLFALYPDLAAKVPLHEWISEPGLPSSLPRMFSRSLDSVKRLAEQWSKNELPVSDLETASWSVHEWLYFLRSLPADLNLENMRELDVAFKLTQAKNTEILQQWLLMATRNRYEPAYARLELFLAEVGRRIYIKPLYEELVKTEEGMKLAQKIYRSVRSSYHPICQATVDKIVRRPELVPSQYSVV